MHKHTHQRVHAPRDAVAQIKTIPSGTVAILLDAQYHVIQVEPIEGEGQSLCEAVTRIAFREHASSVIVGRRLQVDDIPSATVADCRAYQDIGKALHEIDVNLVDDITVGNTGYRSMLEAGSLALLRRARSN